MKTEHFTAKYSKDYLWYEITANTDMGDTLLESPIIIHTEKDEVSQSSINWIIENLNKLVRYSIEIKAR